MDPALRELVERMLEAAKDPGAMVARIDALSRDTDSGGGIGLTNQQAINLKRDTDLVFLEQLDSHREKRAEYNRRQMLATSSDEYVKAIQNISLAYVANSGHHIMARMLDHWEHSFNCLTNVDEQIWALWGIIVNTISQPTFRDMILSGAVSSTDLKDILVKVLQTFLDSKSK